MGVYQIHGKEFISICKQYKALRYPDSLELGFTIVTSALKYVCQTREKSSTKFVVLATVFVSIIAYQ